QVSSVPETGKCTDIQLLQIVKEGHSGRCGDLWGPHDWHKHCRAPWAFDWEGRFHQLYWHLIGATNESGDRLLSRQEMESVMPKIPLNTGELRQKMWPPRSSEVPLENRRPDVELLQL